MRQALLDSTHGKLLIKLGMSGDIDFCSQVGLYGFVPIYSKGIIKVK
jgi:phosphosulfolactate phosphohydrolase-like enzyme